MKFPRFKFRVSRFRFHISSFGFRFSIFRVLVSGFMSRDLGIKVPCFVRVSEFWPWILGFTFQVSCVIFFGSGLVFRFSRFFIRASRLVFRVLGFGPQVPGFVRRGGRGQYCGAEAELLRRAGEGVIVGHQNLPRGVVRLFNEKSTWLRELTLGPYVVHVWSRNTPASGFNESGNDPRIWSYSRTPDPVRFEAGSHWCAYFLITQL